METSLDITLDARPESKLDWGLEKVLLQSPSKVEIFFDFGWEKGIAQHPMDFATAKLAVRHFAKTWEAMALSHVSCQPILYKGQEIENCIQGDCISSSQILAGGFSSRHQKRLQAINLFSHYLTTLAALLPTSLADPYFIFNPRTSLTVSETYHLFSLERFPYLQPVIHGKALYEVPETVKTGVLFPKEDCCTQSALDAVEEISCFLDKQSIAHTIFSETFGSERWDLLDDLIISPYCQAYGLRIAKGFCCAGGRAIFCNKDMPRIEGSITWEEYIRLKENRGRGI